MLDLGKIEIARVAGGSDVSGAAVVVKATRQDC